MFDLRRFIPGPEIATKRPKWPTPDLSKQPFQRNLGAIEERPLGGVRGWVAETQVCEIRDALTLAPQIRVAGTPLVRTKFKRLYADGEGGAQFSLGVPVPVERSKNLREQAEAIETILSSILISRHGGFEATVAEAGSLVADLFVAGSSKGNRIVRGTPVIEVGRPLIILQGLRREEVEKFSKRSRTWGPGGHSGSSWLICNLTKDLSLSTAGPVLMLDAGFSDANFSRSIRIILARLYLEMFCFERSLALLLASHKMLLEASWQESLLSRIALAADRLAGSRAPRATRGGEIYEQLSEAFDRVHRPGRLDELLAALRSAGARPALVHAVNRAAMLTDVLSAEGNLNVTYVNYGQVGSMGQNAQASNFNQEWIPGQDPSLVNLAAELQQLQGELRSIAKTGEELDALAAITHAREAAEAGDGSKVLVYLAKTGRWVFDLAEKIGVGLVVALLKSKAGF